jgi:hypothetical protein
MVCRAMDSEIMITAFRQAPRTAVLLSLAAAAALGACGGTVALESSSGTSGTTGSPGTSGTSGSSGSSGAGGSTTCPTNQPAQGAACAVSGQTCTHTQGECGGSSVATCSGGAWDVATSIDSCGQPVRPLLYRDVLVRSRHVRAHRAVHAERDVAGLTSATCCYERSEEQFV